MEMEDIEFDTNFDFDRMKECRHIVLSVHGVGSSKDGNIQRTVKDFLKKQDVGVVSFNLIGNGVDFVTVEEYMSQFGVVEDWARKNFENAEISLFGSSFGGYLMLQYFAKNPDKYKTLILRSPAIDIAKVSKATDITKIIKTEIEDAGLNGDDWRLEACDAKEYQPYSPELIENYSKHVTFETGQNSKINIVVGENDDVVDMYNYKKLQEGGAHVFVIDGAGHRFASDHDLEAFGQYTAKIAEGAKINWL